MKLLFLIGNTAVGKMTVGQELIKITELRLFHNHMMIEPVKEIYGYFRRDVVMKLRDVIFEDFAASEYYGMVLTFLWTFDQQSSWDYVSHISEIFQKFKSDIYYVELVATKEIRLQRNVTENRLKHKPSKRDIEMSNYWFFSADDEHRCESYDGEITFDNYLKIDTSFLSPAAAAKIIKEKFHL